MYNSNNSNKDGADSSYNGSSNNLLHPETLSTTDLTELLQKRGVNIQAEQHDKYQLVELFYSNVLPLPQRTYRLTNRGKVLHQSQLKLDRSQRRVQFSDTKQVFRFNTVKRSAEGDGDIPAKKAGLVNDPTGQSNVNTNQTNSRLMPAINFERKTIKLASSSLGSNTDRQANMKHKLIPEQLNAVEGTPNKKARTKISWP